MNKLFEKALKRKEKRMIDNNCYKHWVYDKLFFDKVKMILGGNVRLMITGAAPINDDVKQFFKLSAGCRMHEAYGQTECTGISHTTDENDPTNYHAGGPMVQLEMMLEDIPGMNYLSTDKDENGRLEPRGEICVRGRSIIPGYWKMEDKTSEAIDEDGWLHTGDVGKILYDT